MFSLVGVAANCAKIFASSYRGLFMRSVLRKVWLLLVMERSKLRSSTDGLFLPLLQWLLHPSTIPSSAAAIAIPATTADPSMVYNTSDGDRFSLCAVSSVFDGEGVTYVVD